MIIQYSILYVCFNHLSNLLAPAEHVGDMKVPFAVSSDVIEEVAVLVRWRNQSEAGTRLSGKEGAI
jgi:hypothetical protein